MKYLVALLAVAAAVQLSVALDREKAREVVHDYRVKSQNLHIDDLEEDVEKLEAEFADLGDIPDDATIAALKARIRNLEGLYQSRSLKGVKHPMGSISSA